MDQFNSTVSMEFSNTERNCPIGETTGKKMISDEAIPVISCEGSCIRGEIARLAANMLAKEPGYGRGCHGEFFTVPQSAMAGWANQADKIVVIDGCFLHCHGRMMAGLFPQDRLAVFDALLYYGKYTDIMDIDAVPEPERRATAKVVLHKVLEVMNNGSAISCSTQNDQAASACQIETAGNSCCSG